MSWWHSKWSRPDQLQALLGSMPPLRQGNPSLTTMSCWHSAIHNFAWQLSRLKLSFRTSGVEVNFSTSIYTSIWGIWGIFEVYPLPQFYEMIYLVLFCSREKHFNTQTSKQLVKNNCFERCSIRFSHLLNSIPNNCCFTVHIFHMNKLTFSYQVI